ncbi:hypothetical protein QR680_007963 [Steinernema hermaphroditum]|nr:hypothetical protein QR680_007963 [Steinernema hermaphroditum]
MVLESELFQKTAENDALRADEIKLKQQLDHLKFQLKKTGEALLVELENYEGSEDLEREIDVASGRYAESRPASLGG